MSDLETLAMLAKIKLDAILYDFVKDNDIHHPFTPGPALPNDDPNLDPEETLCDICCSWAYKSIHEPDSYANLDKLENKATNTIIERSPDGNIVERAPTKAEIEAIDKDGCHNEWARQEYTENTN